MRSPGVRFGKPRVRSNKVTGFDLTCYVAKRKSITQLQTPNSISPPSPIITIAVSGSVVARERAAAIPNASGPGALATKDPMCRTCDRSYEVAGFTNASPLTCVGHYPSIVCTDGGDGVQRVGLRKNVLAC